MHYSCINLIISNIFLILIYFYILKIFFNALFLWVYYLLWFCVFLFFQLLLCIIYFNLLKSFIRVYRFNFSRLLNIILLYFTFHYYRLFIYNRRFIYIIFIDLLPLRLWLYIFILINLFIFWIRLHDLVNFLL
jgi:hypothetical protein